MPLRPAKTEFHQSIRRRNRPNPPRLRRDETFVIHDHRKRRFQNHRLRRRRMNPHQNFARERHRPLRHRINIAREAERFQIFQKSVRKSPETPQIRNVLLIETETREKLRQMRQPRHHRVPAAERIRAIKPIENHAPLMLPQKKQPVRHRELIQIRHSPAAMHTRLRRKISNLFRYIILLYLNFPKYPKKYNFKSTHRHPGLDPGSLSSGFA